MKTTMKNGNLFCPCCGSTFKLKKPCPVNKCIEKMDAFETLHKDCEQTWEEPKADMSEGTQKRAMWWLESGDQGLSSRTMWDCFMGRENCRVSYPYDPDDFSRCYKLLEAVPEWKEKLPKLKELSWQWSNLVDNWPKLNVFYENMLITKKRNGMSEFMETLITKKGQ